MIGQIPNESRLARALLEYPPLSVNHSLTTMKTKVCISPGNSKVGNVPNVSLVPCKDCGKDVPCRKDCYALKAWRAYPSVKRAWQSNSRVAHVSPSAFFAAIRQYLVAKAPRFFRWHVAGDFLSQAYVDQCFEVAREFPTTRFLAFTKRHDFDYSQAPANFTVVFSMWPKWGDVDDPMPRAWMQDGTETRVPSNALECPGNCEHCGMCWNLRSLKRDVVFHKH